jgi:ubiquitin carboxyl-terminal hydrolase 2/21
MNIDMDNPLEGKTDLMAFFANKGINGLMNIGNTCYVNTMIQCLGHCTSFLHFVLSGKYHKKRDNIVDELRDIFIELWIHNNGVMPNKFLKYIKNHITAINVFEQNDIHEFLMLFIDRMNRDISEQVNPHQFLSKLTYEDTQIDKLKKRLDKAWINTVHKEYSPIIDYFHGQYISQIICGNCKKLHHTYELFNILDVPIHKENKTLTECLSQYTDHEYLNVNDNAEWKCDNCKESVKSLKTMKFWRLPKILIVCLKRFTHDLRKKEQDISIPQELDLTQYAIGTSQCSYSLKSIACHSGSFGRGHYYSVCKNPNGNWYRIDDTVINKMNEYYDFPSVAYVMFYELT